jgi:hypothetical protein
MSPNDISSSVALHAGLATRLVELGLLPPRGGAPVIALPALRPVESPHAGGAARAA